MEDTVFTHERRSRWYFVTRFGVDNIFTRIPQNLVMIDVVHKIYSRCKEYKFFLMRDEAHSIDSWGMGYTAFILERRRSRRHLLMIYGVQGIYSWETEYLVFCLEIWSWQYFNMDSTEFTYDRWSTQHLLKIHGVHGFFLWEMKSTALTHEGWGPQHLLMRGGLHSIYSKEVIPTAYGVHSIYSWENECTTCTYESRSEQCLLLRDGIHNIQCQEMESKAVSHEIWSPLHLLTRDGIRSI